MGLAQLRGRPYALVGPGGRHADVGEHDVGLLGSTVASSRRSLRRRPTTSMSASVSSRRVTASRTR